MVMAEAMELGTAVIATDWSANTEFMNEDVACMVPAEVVELDHDSPPTGREHIGHRQTKISLHIGWSVSIASLIFTKRRCKRHRSIFRKSCLSMTHPIGYGNVSKNFLRRKHSYDVSHEIAAPL